MLWFCIAFEKNFAPILLKLTTLEQRSKLSQSSERVVWSNTNCAWPVLRKYKDILSGLYRISSDFFRFSFNLNFRETKFYTNLLRNVGGMIVNNKLCCTSLTRRTRVWAERYQITRNVHFYPKLTTLNTQSSSLEYSYK